LPTQLSELTPDGRLRLNLHPGQTHAWVSKKRIVAIIAGSRSGKTSFGPYWLYREMCERKAGDYLVAAPDYRTIDKAAGPELEYVLGRLFRLGSMRIQPPEFRISAAGQEKLWGKVHDRRCRIIVGHGDDPESLESMTAKAAWIDEGGQKRFKTGSWEAVQRRLSYDQGRTLITTTPYNLTGWLKKAVYDPWMDSGKNHPEIDVVNFESIMNPGFPREEWDRAQRTMPRWKFDLFYRGVFTRPAGLIYDCFNSERHEMKRFPIPGNWPRYLGLDFGGEHTAAIFLAEELNEKGAKTGRLFAYREYPEHGQWGQQTAKGHVERLLHGEPMRPYAIGGSGSEGQWRAEFALAGLPVTEPRIVENSPTGRTSGPVEVGISRVYATIAAGQLIVLDDLEGLIGELESYSRVLDENGQPTEKIEAKETYHRADALRYVLSWLKGGEGKYGKSTSTKADESPLAKPPRGMFADEPKEWKEFRGVESDEPDDDYPLMEGHPW
jgi:hypothetical protein